MEHFFTNTMSLPGMDVETSSSQVAPTYSGENDILILCGLDGVLIEPEPEAHIAAHLDAVRDVWGVDVAREEFWYAVKQGGLTDRAIAQALLQYRGIDTSLVSAREVNKWRIRCGELFSLYASLNEFKPEPLPHTIKGLQEACSVRSVTISIATGNLQEIAKKKLALTDMDDFLTTDSGGFGDFTLTRVELLKDALYTNNWDPADEIEKKSMQQRIYLIGDTPQDMLAAKELGLHAIGVSTGGSGIQELREAGAEAVFMRFDRAVSWILNQSHRVWTATDL